MRWNSTEPIENPPLDFEAETAVLVSWILTFLLILGLTGKDSLGNKSKLVELEHRHNMFILVGKLINPQISFAYVLDCT